MIEYIFNGSILFEEKHFEDIMKKKVSIVLLVIIALVAFRWCSGKFGEFMRAKMMGAMMTPKVKLSQAGEIEYKNEIEAPGRIVAKYSVDLVARVDGYLQEKRFNEGDFVKKGQVLFIIEPQQYLIALNKAQADLATARAQAVKASKDFARSKELVAKDYVTPRDLGNNEIVRSCMRQGGFKNIQRYIESDKKLNDFISKHRAEKGKSIPVKISSLKKLEAVLKGFPETKKTKTDFNAFLYKRKNKGR